MRAIATKSCGMLMIGFCLLGMGSCVRSAAAQPHARIGQKRAAVLSGNYTRVKARKDENQSAKLEVKQIAGGKMRFHLVALWWSVGGDSPHNGEIEATVPLKGRTALYTEGDYRLKFQFDGDKVTLTESGENIGFGANVQARGTYRLDKKGKRK